VFILLLSSFIFFNFLNKSKEVNMIDLTDKKIEEALEFAKKNKLDLVIEKEYNDNVEYDRIISQNIEIGTVIKENDRLLVIVSLGKISKDEYMKYNVNELGRVPIMMYHGIHNLKNSETGYTGGNIDSSGYQRTSEAFINDLEFYYENGYRMIRLNDYINGIIDVQIGKSPIVLTFDDGLKNNINVTGLDDNGNIIIDPNCAVGIMESFKTKYPDFNITATFFLNGGLFEQPKYNDKILKWLIDNGYDIGNHSYNHANFVNIDSDQSQLEIGKMYEKLENIIPGKYVNIVALPFGSPYDKKHDNFSYILNGKFNATNYQTEATLRVGWESEFSPFSKNFDKTFLKRIRAYDNNGEEFDIEMNFKLLEKTRYISDGNKNKIVVRDENLNLLNEKIDLEIISY
jgi:peptidoglycan/xylan/chitin deacetylase (PgdA/CDA1 family)